MKFVFDLDGTICFKGQPVSEKILIALEKLEKSGHEVIFASARPVRDLLPVLHERFHQYPMIGGNGSIVAIKGEIIATFCFDKDTLFNIIQLLKTYNASYLIDGDWDYAYTGPTTHPILNNLDPQGRAKNVKLDNLHSIVKILVLTSDNMKEVEKQLNNMNVVVHYHGKEGIIDISPNGIDKWSGLQLLGLKKGEYIAFGNDANDITMFQHAMYSIMIGDSLQLAPFSTEQLAVNDNTENILVERLGELGDKNIKNKFVTCK